MTDQKPFFTSDPHFNHKNIMKFCPTTRHGDSVEHMNELIVQAHNSVVPPDGVVYILGDVCFGSVHNAVALLRRMNGTKHLILGNHDKKASQFSIFCSEFASMQTELTISVDKQEIYMNHRAHRVWYNAHYGAWHLFGHSHGGLPPHFKSMDVGIDARPLGDMKPFTFDEIAAFMADQPMLGHHDA